MKFVKTKNGKIHYREWGNRENPPVLLIHGNTISSSIWECVANRFSAEKYYLALDLRGFGKTEMNAGIDSTHGVFDWVDDIEDFAEALALKNCSVWGHSLGGNILWGLLSRSPHWISEYVFISPGSPFGFGGTAGAEGRLINEDGAGTGAGMLHPRFLNYLKNHDKGTGQDSFDPISVFGRLFHKKPTSELLGAIIESSFELKIGDEYYPGTKESSENWPFIKPGKIGNLNALSPIYQTEMIVQLMKNVERKVPIKWIYGKNDPIVCNQSYADAGFLGKSNILPDWPGEERFPIQPMWDQIRYVLSHKERQGFPLEIFELEESGHFPFLENTDFWKIVQ